MTGILADQKKLKELQGLVHTANVFLYRDEPGEEKKLKLSQCLMKVNKGLAEVQEAMFDICMEAGVSVPVEDFPNMVRAAVMMKEYGNPQSIQTSEDVFKATGKQRAVKEDALAVLHILGDGHVSNCPNKRQRAENDEKSATDA